MLIVVLEALCIGLAIVSGILSILLFRSDQARVALSRLADLDGAVGIYGRYAFYRSVRRLLDRAQPGERYVIVQWDIDRFKIYNDMFGTDAGDKLLQDIGAYIRSTSGDVEAYGHLWADHFAYCTKECNLHVDLAVERMIDWFAQYPVEFAFVPCFGVYVIDEPELDVSVMCDRALLALRSVKEGGPEHYAYYDASMRRQLVREQEFQTDMRAALEEEQFKVWFQPQYDYHTGEVVGAEALVRWEHPVKGLISPGEFIPVFERNGSICDLDAYVWERTCRWMSRWLSMSDELVPISVSVNISRIDVLHCDLPTQLHELLDKYHLPVDYLKLEITESAYVEMPERIMDTVRRLREDGFTVEMDDFGSGLSSLNTLKDVPVDILKMDMQFLSGRNTARGGNILGSVMRMARWLDLPVVAEGVETREQAEFLSSIGCRYMQGYLFAKPMPAEEFEQLLRRSEGNMRPLKLRERTGLADAILWEPNDQFLLLFNNLIGPAAFLEYFGDTLEAVRYNDEFSKTLQLNREVERTAEHNLLHLIPPEDRAPYLDMLRRAIDSGEQQEWECRYYVGGDPEQVGWVRIKIKLMSQNLEHYIFFATLVDTTARNRLEKQAEEERLWQDERYRVLSEGTNAITFDYDVANDRMFYHVRGYDSVVIDTFAKTFKQAGSRIAPEGRQEFLNRLATASGQKEAGTLELRHWLDPAQKDFRWGRVHYVCVTGSGGQVIHIVGRIDDIQEEKERDERRASRVADLERRAEYDAVTGILNRGAFEARVSEALNARVEQPGVLLVFDLDDFKGVNDNYGHLQGDKLLRQVGQVISRNCRSDDVVGRIGGDEFAVYLRQITGDNAVTERARQFIADIRMVTRTEADDGVAVSVGASWANERDTCFSDLFGRADQALYRVKEQGKNNFAFYDPSLDG